MNLLENLVSFLPSDHRFPQVGGRDVASYVKGLSASQKQLLKDTVSVQLEALDGVIGSYDALSAHLRTYLQPVYLKQTLPNPFYTWDVDVPAVHKPLTSLLDLEGELKRAAGKLLGFAEMRKGLQGLSKALCSGAACVALLVFLGRSGFQDD